MGLLNHSMTAFCIPSRITDTPTSTTAQNKLALKLRNLAVTQDQAVGDKATLASFSSSSGIK